MSYSAGITTWSPGTVLAGQKRGWMGRIWTASIDTTQMPAGDSSDWVPDVPIGVMGISFLFLPDNRQFLQTKITGITMMGTHINRPPAVYVSGITVLRNVQRPYLIIS